MEHEIFYIILEDRFYRHILDDGYTADYHLEKIFDKEQVIDNIESGHRERNVIATNDFDFPEHFHFVLDPDYSMINKYGLRWDAPKETAYPSTFVIDKNGKVVYSKVSSTHGGRAAVEEVLGVLESL